MFSAIFKLNAKRFWWISAFNAFLLAILFVLPQVNTEYYYFPDVMLNVFALVFGAVNGWAVFGYLNSPKSVGFYHSTPASRNTIFAANVAFGALSSVIPHLVTGIFLPIVTAGIKNLPDTVCFGYIFSRGAGYSLTLFALACFAQMFTGSTAAAKVFTPILAILPFFLEGLFFVFKDEFLYGAEFYGNISVLKSCSFPTTCFPSRF